MTYTNLHPFIKRLIWAVVVLVVVATFAAMTRSLLLLFLSPALAGWVLFPPSDEAIERAETEDEESYASVKYLDGFDDNNEKEGSLTVYNGADGYYSNEADARDSWCR